MRSRHPQRDRISVLKQTDCRRNCAGAAAAAQLEAVNVAGVRSPDMYTVFILYLRGRGRLWRVGSKQKRRRVTCSVRPGLITWRSAVTAGWWHSFFFFYRFSRRLQTNLKGTRCPFLSQWASVFGCLYRLCLLCPRIRSEDVSHVFTPYITTDFSLSEPRNRSYSNIRCKWSVTSSVLQVVNTIHVQYLHVMCDINYYYYNLI